MNVLILGGTVFLGRHLVDAAQARGHVVTTFSRGRHPADLPPAVEQLRGDRNGDLEALRGRSWDVAIDTSGYVPRVVRASADLLAASVEHYTFVSSISVYADFGAGPIDEQTPVATLDDPTVEDVSGETYGPLKALCEQAAEAAMPGRVLNVRPGLIVGPYDPTDRFTYWVRRLARGGDVLAPGKPERPVQIIDARDLAEWILDMAEQRKTGVFNATGPDRPLAMGEMLATCRDSSGSDARLHWVDEEVLIEADVGPWIELPLWIPSSDASMQGLLQVDCSRALAEGLRFRPLRQTVEDTLAWDATRPAETELGAGLKPEREAELLRLWWDREQNDAGSMTDAG